MVTKRATLPEDLFSRYLFQLHHVHGGFKRRHHHHDSQLPSSSCGYSTNAKLGGHDDDDGDDDNGDEYDHNNYDYGDNDDDDDNNDDVNDDDDNDNGDPPGTDSFSGVDCGTAPDATEKRNDDQECNNSLYSFLFYSLQNIQF